MINFHLAYRQFLSGQHVISLSYAFTSLSLSLRACLSTRSEFDKINLSIDTCSIMYGGAFAEGGNYPVNGFVFLC